MTSDVTSLQSHAIHSRQYLENALLALQNDEAGKAGELLWGSVAQAVQAVAVYKNRNIQTHREFKNFVIQIAKDLNDEAIQTDFILGEGLHHNFYSIQQEPYDIALLVPTVQRFVNKLLGLIPTSLLEQRPVT